MKIRGSIAAALGGAACMAACRDYAAPPSNRGLVAFEVTPGRADADGAGLLVARAEIDPIGRGVNTSVTFTTTVGTFTSGGTTTATIPVDSLGVAQAQLRAPGDAVDGFVTAASGGVAVTKPVKFDPALPTGIALVANAFGVTAGPGASVQLTATLARARGAPSPGATVTFEITTGVPLAHLSAQTARTGADARAQTFLVLDTDNTGTIVVRASTPGQGGAAIADETTIRVNPRPTSASARADAPLHQRP